MIKYHLQLMTIMKISNNKELLITDLSFMDERWIKIDIF